MKHGRIIIFLFILLWYISPCYGSRNNIKVGVLAYRGKEKCRDRWQPTVDYLNTNIKGYSFVLVPLTFEAVNNAVQKREIDFILVNSSMFITISINYKISPIATLETLYRGKTYKVFGGVIFTRKNNSKINGINDLAGTSFAAVKKSSFGGWQTAWFTMKKNGFNPYKKIKKLSFGLTHDAVVMAVKNGEVDAGTVRTDILEKMVDEGKIKLSDFKIINKRDYSNRHFPFLCSTALYPEWPLSHLEHVAPELCKKVAVALINMPKNSIPAQAAQIGGWAPPSNYIKVEKCLQELRVGPFADYERVTFKKLWRDHSTGIILSFALAVLLVAFIIYIIVMNTKMQQAATAIKKELAQRRKAEKEMRQIFDSSGDGMVLLSNDKSILQFNEQYCKMLGYTKAEIKGKSCMDFCFMSGICNTDDCILNQIKRSERVEHDILLKRKDGSTIPTIMTAVPYCNVNGEIIGTIQMFKDITYRIEAQKQVALQAEQRGKLEMSISILHDIGNAITGMESLVKIQKEDGKWPEDNALGMLQKMFKEKSDEIDQVIGSGKGQQIQVFIDKLKRALAGRKKRLDDTSTKLLSAIGHVTDILYLQRMYANPNVVKPVLINVLELIQDSVSMFSASLKKRMITVNIEAQGHVPEIKLDRTRIMQVIINILNNACESFDSVQSNNSRKLDIIISKKAENIEIVISDNAAGISTEQSTAVFDNGYTTKKNGSGIGLYQCKSIIESHGGNIDFSSDGPGRGASLTITLPIHNQ